MRPKISKKAKVNHFSHIQRENYYVDYCLVDYGTDLAHQTYALDLENKKPRVLALYLQAV